MAVVDEIQMLKDVNRGWAWTRALLGIVAEEIHVCGEAAAIDVVKEIMLTAGEEVEVRNYKRLTELTVEDSPLGTLNNIRPGDCIVCFNTDAGQAGATDNYNGLSSANTSYSCTTPGLGGNNTALDPLSEFQPL